jgi:hypothetical protein
MFSGAGPRKGEKAEHLKIAMPHLQGAAGDHGRDRVLETEEHASRVDRYDPVPSLGAVKVLFGAAGTMSGATSSSTAPHTSPLTRRIG